MDPLFSRMTKRYTPKMNETVMRGLATESMKHFEAYIDAQIRSICVGMPDAFRYVGCERCTVEEEFEYATRTRNTKRSFDLAKTNKYLVKYYWEFTDPMGNKEILTKHIYLPYVTEGGLLHISGTEMHLIPVLSDKVFTPTGDMIFVRLVQDRNNFFRFYHTVLINGRRESRHVAHAEIYRNSNKNKPQVHERTTRAETVLPHYLLARYGFTGVLERYLNCKAVVGDDRSITPARYPADSWVILASTRIQPKKSNLDKVYYPSRLAIAIPKDQYTHEVECVMVGLFYVVDHFPQRFSPRFNHPELDKPSAVVTDFDKVLAEGGAEAEKIYALIGKKYLALLNDIDLWRILIGHIRFSGIYPEHLLLSSINEHFDTIEPYLDQAVKAKLSENNIHLDNYFDLLYYIQANFNRMIVENEKNGLCVYGKSLEILQYVAYDILYGITMMKFKINKVASRGNPLSLRDVSEPLRRIVRPGAIFWLQSGDKLVCEVVGYSGDHLYPKITAVVAQQENRAGGGRMTDKRIVPGPEHWVDVSMVFAGSVLNLPKSNPTPIVRINTYITIDEHTGTIVPNKDFEHIAEKYKALFKH